MSEWSDEPVITVEPWVFRVSPFPPGSDAGRHWCVWIKSMGDGRWRVLEYMQASPETFLTSAGEWTTDREADIDHNRAGAERLALEAIPNITIMGRTYADAIRRFLRAGAPS